MAHQHNVVDGDIHFKINHVTRGITRADSTKSSLVVGDHNSERFTFEIPKIVEGHDMSLCNVVRVHYLNTSADNKANQSLGVYEVDDLAPDLEDENIMRFSWLISSKATQHVGPLAFTIQFACMTGFKVDYSWQSGIFSAITVSDAVNGSEVVINEYADILQQWWEQLYASSELPINIMPFDDFVALNGDTKNGMLYLLLDDPLIEDIEKIPSIEQDIDDLASEVETAKSDISNLASEVETAKSDISNLASNVAAIASDVENNRNDYDSVVLELNNAIMRNEEYIINQHEDILALQKNVGDNKTQLTSLQDSTNNHETRLDDLQETVDNIGSKWSFGNYVKLYEYDTDKASNIYKDVTTGMYIIRAERNSSLYSSSVSVILDTLKGELSLTNFAVIDDEGGLIHYVIRTTVIDSVNGIMRLKPYRIVENISEDSGGNHVVTWKQSTVPATDITLYGRCIYTNPVG